MGGKRPPNIIETRIAAEGALAFDQAPETDGKFPADAVSGRVVIELDILTPHPRTEVISLKVTKAALFEFPKADTVHLASRRRQGATTASSRS